MIIKHQMSKYLLEEMLFIPAAETWMQKSTEVELIRLIDQLTQLTEKSINILRFQLIKKMCFFSLSYYVIEKFNIFT